MNLISEIRKPILDEMLIFKKKLSDLVTTNNPILSPVYDFVFDEGGKQLRPMFTLLSAKLCGTISETTYCGALAVELLHNASLLHDDVVDNSAYRRGKQSVNGRWSNKIAVLAGDNLLSKSMLCVAQSENLNILHEITNMGEQLTAGELTQIHHFDNILITEDDYFSIVRMKTSSLITACVTIGAFSTGASPDDIEIIRKYGELVGICFQIKDDIFDYSFSPDTGKPTGGKDLQEGKITLPLIYALSQFENIERKDVISIIQRKEFTPDNIDKILLFVHKQGGIDYAIRKMEDIKNQAIQTLNYFPKNEIRDALVLCAEFAVSRNF